MSKLFQLSACLAIYLCRCVRTRSASAFASDTPMQHARAFPADKTVKDQYCRSAHQIEFQSLATCACRYVQNYNPSDPRTHSGKDLRRLHMADLYKEYGLDAMTVDFIGHAIALHNDDSYLGQPALATVEKIKLYNDSLQRFAGTKSPYIYPLYGLGELPQVRCRTNCHKAGFWGGNV